MDLQNGDLSESMAQVGKKMVAQRSRGMLGKPDVRDALYKGYSGGGSL
jgi:hypothetical protein